MSAGGDDAAYSTDDDTQPESELMASALVPKFAAALSLFGSSMILYELYLDWRQGNARDGATSRILVSMSVSDIIFSLGWFLTTWPAPSDLTYIVFNVGNRATCVFQGFLIQLGYVASPLFNVTLALFFLLRIRYRWTDFRLRQMEPWIQGSIWVFSFACAIYPIPLGLYNNGWEVCWLEFVSIWRGRGLYTRRQCVDSCPCISSLSSMGLRFLCFDIHGHDLWNST
jgi:hypothetical protein